MEGGGGYAVRYVPSVDERIDEAIAWWRANRRAAADLLARELDAALDNLAALPKLGRRVRLRGHPTARRLLLRRTGYHLYYVVLERERVVLIVYFRHGRRRPMH